MLAIQNRDSETRVDAWENEGGQPPANPSPQRLQ